MGGNKGYKFEIDEVDFWRAQFPDIDKEYIYRVEGSGRSKNATKTGAQSMLEGDVSLELAKALILPKDILIECKHYKTTSKKKQVNTNRPMKSFSIKKEWVDQALHEAEKNDRWSLVAIKFKGVRPNDKSLRNYFWYDGKFGNSIHYIIPQRHFIEILRYVKTIKESKKVDLGQIPTNELFEELRKRLDK